MRTALLVALVASAGCGLDVTGVSADGGAASGGDDASAGSDGGSVDAALCPDGEGLLVCMSFDTGVINLVPDGPGVTTAANVAEVRGREGRGIRLTPGSDTSPRSEVSIQDDPRFDAPNATYEMFVWLESPPAPQGQAYLLDLDNRFALRIFPDGSFWCWRTQGPPLPLRQWTHVACVVTKAGVTQYVNGQVAGSSSLDGHVAEARAIGLGHDAPEVAQSLDGMLDNVRIFATARTAEQMQAAARRGL